MWDADGVLIFTGTSIVLTFHLLAIKRIDFAEIESQATSSALKVLIVDV